MRRLLALLCLLPLLAAPPGAPLTAQEAPTDLAMPAALVADRVALTRDRLLVAEGNVEILQGDTRLTAARVTYDGATDTLTMEGPIVLRDGTSSVILASQAELSGGLRDGILRGARIVLNQQLQIAATEIQRVGGRYSQALQVGATSCHVCDTGRPPLWQIRAERIIHDQEARQLYFDNAQLQVMGVPILFLPRLRLPDPTLDRATGLLPPEFRTSSLLGYGVKLPYFVALGESRDLTVTPFIATDTRTLEFRYRQAFARGELTWNTFLSADDFGPDAVRYGVLAEGRFAVAGGYALTFDIEAASDRSYFPDYDYSDKDRLDSALTLARTTAARDTEVELVFFRSLRDDENNNTFPSVIFDARRDLAFRPGLLGGSARLRGDLQAHLRASESSVDGDGDGVSDGLDVVRAGLTLDWAREWIAGPGLVFGAQARVGADSYLISDDALFESTATRGEAGIAVSVAWPLMARGADGARHMLTPKVQLAATTQSAAEIPNEDSTRVEFDEGNLFALNRATGEDVVEDGTRLDFGLTWTRAGPRGWESTLTLGRVARLSGENDFSDASGLAGDTSNWLVSGTLATEGSYDVIGRITLDNDLAVKKTGLRVGYAGGRVRAASSFAYLSADSAEDRGSAASELALSGEYDVTPSFTALADFRYDFTTEATTEAGIGLRWINECVEIALSASRSFTASASVTPSTDFGLTVGLRGFGTGASTPRVAPRCR
ncbi:MAG: LPS assembly protein LptD [Pseudomonadota bacterium]